MADTVLADAVDDLAERVVLFDPDEPLALEGIRERFQRIVALLNEDGTEYDASTGHTAKLQARVTPDDASTVIALTEIAGLTLADGKITATFAHAATALLSFEKAYYDIELTLTAGTVVSTVWKGVITLLKGVTR